MRHLLNASTQRQLKFIECLFHLNDWTTVDTVAEQLGCSARVLRSDIQAINHLFHPFHIASSIKQGIRLIWPQHLAIDYIYANILQDSSEFQLLNI